MSETEVPGYVQDPMEPWVQMVLGVLVDQAPMSIAEIRAQVGDETPVRPVIDKCVGFGLVRRRTVGTVGRYELTDDGMTRVEVWRQHGPDNS